MGITIFPIFFRIQKFFLTIFDFFQNLEVFHSRFSNEIVPFEIQTNRQQFMLILGIAYLD